MLQLSPQHRIFVCIPPVDFRNGIEGLGGYCRRHLQQDPMSGAIFVFRNRRRTAIKRLVYDGQGFWLCMKRLSAGRLQWWPQSAHDYTNIQARELHILLWNGNPEQAQLADDWKHLN
jgi:transposase